MASRPLARVRGIEPNVVQLLHAAGITTIRDLFMASTLKIMSVANLSLCDAQRIVSAASEAAVPESATALSCLRDRATKQRYLACGIDELDKALQGGLPLGTLSDICGPPGAGKTQFCIGCVVQAHVCGGGVVYIDTEHKFDPGRLIQIAAERFPAQFSSAFRSDASHRVDSLLEAVKIHRPSTVEEFKSTIASLQEQVIACNVTLIVIDSIAALLRKEGLDEKQKESFVLSQASELKRLAEACHCAVLASNQVTPCIASDPATDCFGDVIISDQMAYVPTLGATWHHCITTRITLAAGATPPAQGLVRITKSPISPSVQLEYRINAKGLQC